MMVLYKVSVLLLILPLVFLLYALIQTIIEKEKRASVILGIVLGLFSIFLVIATSLQPETSRIIILITSTVIYFSGMVLVFPWPKKRWGWERGFPEQIDERNIMFSRNELEPGTERHLNYYREFPEHLKPDNKFRASPGLLSEESAFYQPWIYGAADAAFYTVESLHNKTDGEVNQDPPATDNKGISKFIENWAKDLGCHSIGVTPLNPHHLYKTGGRKHNYNKIVDNKHKYAIVFTVEMDFDRVKSAPKGPIIMESSAQYLRAGTIAVQIASFLRGMGFSSTAHIDGKYQVRCVEVANDAGLGEIGRMGLLMTPSLGPRVRIGVVTTDFPLEKSQPPEDKSLMEFCRICKKCAETCPASAISFEDPKERGGAIQWSINQESCFSYWCKGGTDCGRCISVCPYSHPDNFLHKVVRTLIRKSPLFIPVASKLDDFLYGKKPVVRELPKWMDAK